MKLNKFYTTAMLLFNFAQNVCRNGIRILFEFIITLPVFITLKKASNTNTLERGGHIYQWQEIKNN